MRLIILLVLLLAGCDTRVITDRTPVKSELRNESCSKVGYCYECGLDFDGDLDCGFKSSFACPGKQLAAVNTYEVEGYWKSDSDKRFVYREIEITPLEDCK